MNSVYLLLRENDQKFFPPNLELRKNNGTTMYPVEHTKNKTIQT